MPTKIVSLSNDWSEVGTGASYLEVRGVACVAFGLDMPEADSEAYHKLGVRFGRYLSYGGSEKIYARKNSRIDCKLVITEGT